MKVLDILNPYKILKEEEMLEEAKLSTEFSIGFELEGVCDSDIPELENRGYLPGYHSSDSPSGGSKALLDMLNKSLGLGDGKIERDGSLDTHGCNSTGHAWTFEYGSPIIPFTPTNMNRINKFLSSLKDIGVKTNDSCGFHTHISFKDITRNDVKWILFSIANDSELRQEVSEMEVEDGEPIKFYGSYANDSWFEKLKVNGSFDDWSLNLSTNEKYLIMRIHPEAGTIEWRGPRNFINDGSDAALIKSYIKKLWKLILKIGKLVDEKEYNGFKKSEVLRKLNVSGKFSSPIEIINKKNIDNVTQIILKKPSILVSLSPSKLSKLFDYNTDILVSGNYSRESQEELKAIWNKIPTKNKEIILRAINDKHLNNDIRSILPNIFDAFVTDICIRNNLSNIIGQNYKNLTLTSPQQLETIYKSNWLSYPSMIELMLKNENLVSFNMLKEIVNGKSLHIIGRFKNIPTKIQRMMIRKNPYNIQYINNPDQSIIDELKKKYGEDIEEYILGVL